MSRNISLRFYSSQVIGKRNSVEEIVIFFMREKFRIHDIRVRDGNSIDLYWESYENNEQHIISASYKNCGIEFQCSNGENKLELSVYIGWVKTNRIHPSDTFFVVESFQTALITREENNPTHYSNIFLMLGKMLFEVIKPDFGWIDMESFSGFTLKEDVTTLSISHTYWANFFGQKYLKKYGKEKLLHIPVWHIESLKPAGFLLVLSPILGSQSGEIDLLKNHLN